jgi:hypothetical protein
MLSQHFGLQEESFRTIPDSPCLSHIAGHYPRFASLPRKSAAGGQANRVKAIVLKTIPNTVPFGFIVKPNESSGDLAIEISGKFQSRSFLSDLNPELGNPDFIEIGQTMLLPAC